MGRTMRRIKPPASGAVIFYRSQPTANNKPSGPTTIGVIDPSNTNAHSNNKVGSDGMYNNIVRVLVLIGLHSE